jgi:UDP-N-acetylmuramate dehydrogenase
MNADVDRAVSLALDELGPIGERSVMIGAMTTYRVGGAAAVLARPRDLGELDRVAAARHASGLPVVVLGRGSNMLVADDGFAGIVVSCADLADVADRVDIDADAATVSAGACVVLPVLARQVAAHGLSGFEWAVGVPGSIGGAVRMNAGGHGSDMAASLVDATIVDLDSDQPSRPSRRLASSLGLRFRGSGLRSTQLVLSATLQVGQGDRSTCERALSEIVAWRRANQPGGQNAGSVFVNPVPGEVSAGLLVDEMGLRGLRVGTATVSTKHANFIQADDGGRADDVYELMRVVRERVADGTGYELRTEIRLLGYPELGDPELDGRR